MNDQTRSQVLADAKESARIYVANGGSRATIGDWDSEAFATFRQQAGELFDGEPDDLAAWSTAWEEWHDHFRAQVARLDAGVLPAGPAQ